MTAIVTAAAPWTSRSWRRLGWVLVVGLALTRFVLSPISFEVARAVFAGWFAGAAALVVLGAPSRRPSGAAIAAGLARVGLPLARLQPASVDARGSTPFFAQTADGRSLFVKALGNDERSADLMFRAYRRIAPHDLGDEKAFSSLRRAVEHEALTALAARDLGVRTPRFVGFAAAEPNAFVLAYEAVDGRSLDRVDEAHVSDAVLTSIWEQLALLRTRRIAHRDLRLANIFLGSDGHVWIIDFGFSEIAASDLLLATDVAELLASSSLQVGPERAVDCALEVVGPVPLAAALERLRPWALSGATRHAIKSQPRLLDELRSRVTDALATKRAPVPR